MGVRDAIHMGSVTIKPKTQLEGFVCFLDKETGTEGELGRERHIVQGQTKAVLEQDPGVCAVAQKHSACSGQEPQQPHCSFLWPGWRRGMGLGLGLARTHCCWLLPWLVSCWQSRPGWDAGQDTSSNALSPTWTTSEKEFRFRLRPLG